MKTKIKSLKLSFFLVLIFMLTQALNVQSQTIGNNAEGTLPDTPGPSMNANRYQCTEDMSVTKMYVNIATSGSGIIKCAIYSDDNGVPGTFLMGTNELTNPGTGWKSFDFTSGLALTSGTWYHLVLWTDNTGYVINYADNGVGSSWRQLTYGTWPSSFGPANPSSGSDCIYAQASSTITLGNTAEGTLTDPPANTMCPIRYQCTQNMTTTKMYAKIATSGSGAIKCAIYSDDNGVPGTFLMGTNELTNPGTGWKSFDFTSGLALTSGTWYHLAVWTDNTGYLMNYTVDGVGTPYRMLAYGPWPDSFGTVSIWSGGTYCMYAEGTSTGGCNNPVIIAQPQSITRYVGESVSLRVTATGTGLTYKWKKGGTDISGATTFSYSISSVGSSDAGDYTVVVSGSCGSPISSNNAVLTVNPCNNPSITVQPENIIRTVGEPVTFNITASGSDLTYQWKKGGTNISGATSSSYTMSGVVSGDAGDYTVVVSGACGSPITSSIAVLTVNPSANPAITSQPQSIIRAVGQAVSFNVTATGTSLTYQWKKGGIDISGATTSSYTISNVGTGDAGNYTVVVSGSFGTPVTSNTSVLTIDETIADYYVAIPANGGSDYNPGTFDKPFATWQRAFNKMTPGQLTYVRGGQYYGYDIIFTGSGTAGKLKKLWAYPGETPILSCPVGVINGWGILLQNCNYIHLKGLEVSYFAQEATLHKLSVGIWSFEGATTSNSIFENLNCHHNGIGAVFQGKNNHILNSDFHDNKDPYSSDAYGNADGLDIASVTPLNTDGTTIIEGCRAWNNSDDGFDCSDNDDLVKWINCWGWHNGFASDEVTNGGDGNGFKLGWFNENMPTTLRREVYHCIATKNGHFGFDKNASIPLDSDLKYSGVIKLCSNTCYYNGQTADQWANGINFAYSTESYDIVKNNIVYAETYSPPSLTPQTINNHNNWDIPLTITDADFVSLDASQLAGSRKVDGSLPDIDFLRLSPTSKLVDAGVDVGLPFGGIAPDLGAFETGLVTSSPYLEIKGGNFIVYPNPVNNTLNISGIPGDFKEISLKLFDIRGIELYGAIETGGCKLDMSRYQSGIYFLQIICEGKLTTRKIIKN